MLDPRTVTSQELMDPGITQEFLAQVAQVRPDLWQTIVGHPACYPALSTWINEQLRTQGAQESAGVQPSRPQADSFTQIAEGTRKVAGSAKSIFEQKVAPAVAQLAKDTQARLSQQAATAPGRSSAFQWSLYGISIASVLGILSLFLPLLTSPWGGSFSLFSASKAIDSPTDAPIFFIGFALVLGFTIFYIVTNTHWAGLTSTIIGIVVSVLGLIDTKNLHDVVGAFGISAGIGLWLLILVSLALIILSIMALRWVILAKKA